MKRNIKLFINDILENIDLIEDSIRGMSLKQFKSDRLVVDATLRRLEIIGEAVKNLPNSFKSNHPELPWRDIAGFRDKLIHAYFGVVLDRVWNILKKDLPYFKGKIKNIEIED